MHMHMQFPPNDTKHDMSEFKLIEKLTIDGVVHHVYDTHSVGKGPNVVIPESLVEKKKK